MEKEAPIILAPGVSFTDWESDLQAALVKKGRLAHVFHNLEDIEPAIRPVAPVKGERQSESEYSQLLIKYKENASKWKEGEIEAKNVLIRRLSEGVRPQDYRRMSAKQIYDSIASSREEGAATPYETAVRNLKSIQFTNVEDYCDSFMQHYLSVNSAAESMVTHLSKDTGVNPFLILPGYASFLFVLGTEGIPWLDTWRQTKIFDGSNKYVPLEVMMSTLRKVRTSEMHLVGQALVAAGFDEKSGKYIDGGKNGPLDRCRKCKHHHMNKDCFKQHPELRPKNNRKGKDIKGKAKAATKESTEDVVYSDSDTEDESFKGANMHVAKVSSISLLKNPLLYDTGASHHFIRNKSDFINLQRLSNPFKFDQAIGTSSLTHQGTSLIQIGEQKFKLKESLFSPLSACNIISAVRLKRDHGLVTSNENQLLVRMSDDQPVARLKEIDDVLFIKPLKRKITIQNVKNTAAPGVARVPHVTNAHRWHQRLGHTGQNILKKTAQYSIGMEGIDYSDLITCETCHLSKAQRFVSREPRPTPNEPLDEVFIDKTPKQECGG